MAARPGENRVALKRVLIADDNTPFRTLTGAMLRGHGLEVFEAADGREALNILLSRRPQLAVLDVLMPTVSGLEVMKGLHDAAPDYHPVIIVVTGVYRSRQWAAEARSVYQVAEYLEKPIGPEDLIKAIARHFPEFLWGTFQEP